MAKPPKDLETKFSLDITNRVSSTIVEEWFICKHDCNFKQYYLVYIYGSGAPQYREYERCLFSGIWFCPLPFLMWLGPCIVPLWLGPCIVS